MDLFFVTISLVFIIFLIISFYMGIIRLSFPLLLIYLLFCFSYIINRDIKNENTPITSINNDKNNNIPKDYNRDIISKKSLNLENSQINDSDKNILNEISKPVVSFNPKPIIIDSNLIIQKDVEKIKYENISSINDELVILEEKDEESFNTLKLKEIMICRGVYKRNPIKPGFNFTNNVDSLFCYTKISNSGPKQEIKHLWFYQDKMITSVVYNIKTSYNYRSWSKKNISPVQVGKWRVDIVDSKENILGSRQFEISSLNDLY